MASVTINFSAVESCNGTSIVFTDTTGQAPVTQSGWTGQLLQNIQDVEILIIPPGSDDSFVIPSSILGSSLPCGNGCTFNINMSYLNGAAGDVMTQGIYKIQYRVKVNDQWLSASSFAWVYGTIKCCVNKMFSDLGSCEDCSTDQKRKEALDAFTLYKALTYAAECGKTKEAEKIFEQVNRLCSYKGPCNSCN
tara:strand:+ start:411 stop:989 length:579 start_codon:yes stop_codon:yes gene_type:complete